MHDVRLIRDVRTSKARYILIFKAYVAHSYRVNKSLKICERDSVILRN